MKNEIQRGDMFYADLTPVIGSEQGGIRPVVIIQNDVGNRHSPTVIAAAITSRTGKKRLPTHIPLQGNCRGLHPDSTVLLEQVRTIDRTRLREYIGKLNADTMQYVDHAIAVSFGLDGMLGFGEESSQTLVAGCVKEQERKHAWIYCAIDAPEDTHGVLKEQFKQLLDYGEQMGFEIMGSSSDIGGAPLWKRSGFQNFVSAVRDKKANTLLIVSRNSLSNSTIQMTQFQAFAERYGLEVYSPMEGRLCFKRN